MLSSLFENHSRQNRKPSDKSIFPSPHIRAASSLGNVQQNHSQRKLNEDENERENSSSGSDGSYNEEREFAQDYTDDENQDAVIPLLPIFDSAQLDMLPVYALTHTIRLMVSQRCDTVLTWEQLRSPQVSQFLLKPIEQEILANHFSAATMYCVMSNCLQFMKEVHTNPANSGTMETRAMICELLAIKFLREYSNRDLIDALCYDFNPLQGQVDTDAQPAHTRRPSWQSPTQRNQSRSARTSCLEIAILAQAKRFIAHPQVIEQLTAIWDGTIVIYASRDSARRDKSVVQHANQGTSYGTLSSKIGGIEATDHSSNISQRVVTLYNPRDATLFKLSRLRVPRYRNLLSTLSFAMLLSLFVAVLVQRSVVITPLEIAFWFWSAGYMMDQLVGFTEQGFGLYLASFWNTIDLGIVLILIVHLFLRIFGIVTPDVSKKYVANAAYDILAADAILLFPRLFSILDHYRYFSQLIIAFRWMATDLVAVLVLIVIAYSGFFVALTLSFGYDGKDSASAVAYALLQITMGYTPAVWDRWESYTFLGQFIMVIFLILCHFLIVTILISALSNSFMSAIRNANEEHQFIFAVNTISIIKSHSLFAYIPPLNVLQWTLRPLRYVLSPKQYVKINRATIQFTHLPILLTIYLYERIVLRSTVVDSTDLVEVRQRQRISQRLPKQRGAPSIVNFRQGQALEEVFKRPFEATGRPENFRSRKKSSIVVNRWMRDMGDELAGPREDGSKRAQNRERQRLGERTLSNFSRTKKSSTRPQSLASDPADLTSNTDLFSPIQRVVSRTNDVPTLLNLDAQDTDDGDDELQTNEDDVEPAPNANREMHSIQPLHQMMYPVKRNSPMGKSIFNAGSLGSINRYGSLNSGHGSSPGLSMRRRPQQIRNISSATMIFNPPEDNTNDEDNIRSPMAIDSRPISPGSKKTSSGSKKTLKPVSSFRLRPGFPTKDQFTFKSAPNLQGLLSATSPHTAHRASLEMDLVSDLGDNKAIGGGYVGAIPASFVTQIDGLQKLQDDRDQEQQMIGRLMMARMNSLEEGFRDVIHEMRENIRSIPVSRNRSPERPAQERRVRRAAMREENAKGKEKIGSNENHSGSSEPRSTDQPEASAEPTGTVLSAKQNRGKGESSAQDKGPELFSRRGDGMTKD